ncbi:hypothetical protein O181_031603 [Austropuccinia psidii MF-1]|uniref:Uncharacterized protein n=1 Tax=Austropuccinia psidii MF-1 TaxID=1389203 RepID=A0A9Q3H4S0_9BASI|nr:hypothetical protein [Austropuccinia psidii MF-1]
MLFAGRFQKITPAHALGLRMSQTYTPTHALGFLHMSHTYAPTTTSTHALGFLHMSHTYAPATSGSTCVTHKWLMPLEIRPSHVLPLCAFVTPMHPCIVRRPPTMSPAYAEMIYGYTKLV